MSVWATRPADVQDLTGRTVGTLRVTGFSHRDAAGIKWHVLCTKCGDRTIETSRRIIDGHLGKGCRIDNCRLDRLPEKRITQHEKWLNSADDPTQAAPAREPFKQPEPKKQEVVPLFDYAAWR